MTELPSRFATGVYDPLSEFEDTGYSAKPTVDIPENVEGYEIIDVFQDHIEWGGYNNGDAPGEFNEPYEVDVLAKSDPNSVEAKWTVSVAFVNQGDFAEKRVSVITHAGGEQWAKLEAVSKAIEYMVEHPA